MLTYLAVLPNKWQAILAGRLIRRQRRTRTMAADISHSFSGQPHFAVEPNADPVAEDARAQLLVDPGFGRTFTDHMVVIRYSEGRGWHDAKVTARVPLTLDPAAAVFHYAQEIFEGLKAYKLADGSMALFRPDANARRFNASARRLAMPELPEDWFVGACKTLVDIDRDWFPDLEGGSLYLRPFMIATEVFLGVKPSTEYLFLVIAAASGNYFKSGAPAVSLMVSQDYTRAAPGGTGAAKCGGNYAASLVPIAGAMAAGHDQVIFLDAVERRWIEELGGMNVFFVFDDGTIQTPPISDTILEGVTRSSLLALARDEGLVVREERYSIDDWRADATSGRMTEAFACGTAAVVTPIGSVTDQSGRFVIGSGGPGQQTQRLKQRLVDIQRGIAPDPHHWVQKID
jgi:branched-chain amino acid aminotransferase